MGLLVTSAGALRLGAAEIDLLAPAGRVESVARRRVLPLDVPVLVIVLDGYFRIFRNSAFARDVTLGLASAGDVLAPGAAFGERSAETGAQALSDASVLMLSHEAWEAHARARPHLYVKMAGSLGRRLLRLQKRIGETSRASAEARVAAILDELAEDYGTAAGAAIKLDLPLSQDDLGRLAGTTRETASAAVARLARDGILRGGRLRGLLVIDRAALARAAGSDA